MEKWTLIRYLHMVALAFFVGGQAMLVVAVTPAIERYDGRQVMRTIARRFAIGSIVALIVLIVTGVMMASEFQLWDSSTLQVKLMLLMLLAVMTAMHIITPTSRALRLTLPLLSLVVMWLGAKMTYG